MKRPETRLVEAAIPELLSGSGEMGRRIREYDWSETLLGDPQNWPQSLRSTVSICLNSNFPIAIYWGKDLTLIYNDAWSPIPGNKHPWALGKPAQEVWPEIWQALDPQFKKAFSGEPGGSTNAFLPMNRHGYTEECYFNFTFTPIYGEGGKVEGVFNAVIETTKTVLNERQLETLSELGNLDRTSKTVDEVLATAAKALEKNNKDFPFAVVYKIADEDNKAVPISYVGTNNEQGFFPRSIDLLSPADDTKNFYRAYTTNAPVISENRGRRKNLPKGYWDIEATHFIHIPITSQNHKAPVAILSAALNPYRQFDGLYQQFVQLIADQITTEVNNVLAYQEERKRAEALAEIDKAKTAFFTNISHEFRTPLTLMLGSLEELLNNQTEAIGNKNAEALQTSHRNALRLLRLVNNLLDFSRFEAGKVRARFQLTDICLYTRELASTFRSVMEQAGLQFHVECDPIVQPVYVDKEMWEKIVLNLLSNAFKYTLTGSIRISLSAASHQVVLKVKDSGIGIPEAELPKMFQRFHRVQNATGRTYEGTGIGLSLVKELVQLHGGDISVKSKVGEGTEFTVSIPTGKHHLPPENILEKAMDVNIALSDAFIEEANSLISKHAADSTKDNFKNVPSVLVVDDNADMRSYIKNILEKKFNVLTASNGMDALLKIKVQKFDAVVSDVMMPIMDGMQLLKTIKETPQTSMLPVILVSARAGEEATVESFDIGADDYLVKPFSAKELLARVRSQVDISRKRARVLKDIYNLFDEVPFAVAALKGPQLIIEYINQYNLNVWRQSREQVEGKPLFEVRPGIERTAASIHEEIYRTGRRFEAKELPISIMVNGREELHYFNAIIDPMRDEDRKIVGQLSVSIDVTDQVIARKKVEESEKQVRILNEHLASELAATRTLQEFNSFVLEDDQTFYRSLLETAMKLLNSDMASVQLYDEGNKELVLVGTKNFHPAAEQLWQRVSASSGSVCSQALTHKTRITVPDIENAEFAKNKLDIFRLSEIRSAQSTPLVSRNGKLIGMLSTHWKKVHSLREEDFKYFDVLVRQAADIIEKKTAEQKIEQSEQRFSNILSQVNAGIAQTDTTGKFIEVNDRFCEITGRTREDLLQLRMKDITYPDDLEQNIRLLEDCVARGKNFFIEKRYLKPDGSVVWVNNSVSIVRGKTSEQDFITAISIDITSQKKAAEKLGESEERFRALVNATSDVVYRMSPDWSEMQGLHGRGFLSATGEPTKDWLQKYIPSKDHEKVRTTIHKAIQTKTVFELEHQILQADGTLGWTFSRAIPILDKEGNVVEWFGAASDVTERNRIQEQLKTNEERYALTIDATNLGIWDFDVKNQVVVGSGKIAAIYGLASNDDYNLSVAFDSVYEDDKKEQGELFQSIINGRVDQTFATEFRIIQKNTGSLKWIRAHGKAFFDEKGQLYRTVGLVTDITNSKNTEDALKESERNYRDLAISLEKTIEEKTLDLKLKNEELKRSEERYHKMIDEVEDYAIILLDKHGIVQNWNKGAEKIKGYKEGEIIGKSFSHFYLPEDREAGLPEKTLDEARQKGKALYEGWRVRKDGSRFWGSIVLTALHDQERNIIGFSKVTRDLTSKKLSEDRMQEYTKQLEFKNRELEQFSYAASHDMKEPLRKILFYVSAVSEKLNDEVDEKSREYLRRSTAAAKRMHELIDDLLIYARTNSSEEYFEQVDLNEIVHEIAVEHKDDFEEKIVRIETENLETIPGIRFQVKQLLENLIGNSVKYKHPERQCIISIKGETVPGAQIKHAGLNSRKQYFHLSVSDNGIGFDPEHSKRMFAIFQRLNNASNTSGSGIGLALCKRIVENHKGYITATGEKNTGARFDLYFPREGN